MNDISGPQENNHSINLSIADLHFNVSSRKLPLFLDYDTSYKQFLITQAKPLVLTVDVSLLFKEELPDISNLTRIFETPESWYMLSGSSGKFIVFQPPNNPDRDPAWIARIAPDLHHVDVYCEKKKHGGSPEKQVIDNPVRYPLDQILLINCLLGKGLLIHAAGITINDKGFLFAGVSGAGKSTICSLFQDSGVNTILSDDRMVVRKSSQEFLMYGTPWAGDAGIAVNESEALQGVFFLKHSSKNRIRKLTPEESLDKFFKVASLPWYDKKDLHRSLDFCDDLLKEINMYELNFRHGPEIISDIISFASG
jgi:hypothetical protein